jgi:hypothetical protein
MTVLVSATSRSTIAAARPPGGDDLGLNLLLAHGTHTRSRNALGVGKNVSRGSAKSSYPSRAVLAPHPFAGPGKPVPSVLD